MNINNKLKGNIGDYGIIVVFLAMVLIFSLASSRFLSLNNVMNVLRQVSIVGIISVGMTFVLLTGGIDLSVGSIAGLSAIGASMLMVNFELHPVLSALIMLAVGILMGLINGFFVTYLNIPPLICTLGMMTSVRGLAYILSGGLPIFGFNQSFVVLGQGYLAFIPIPVIIMMLMFAVGVFYLAKTRNGRYIYAVGGNEEASRLSGISVRTIKLTVYSVSGFTSALAGLVMLARINSGQPNAGEGYEMDVITSCVLGGVSISGGQGKLLIVVFGVLIMGILTNGMTMLTINEYVQRCVKGMVLILAVALDQFVKSKKIQVAIEAKK